jgi:uncharacterized protein
MDEGLLTCDGPTDFGVDCVGKSSYEFRFDTGQFTIVVEHGPRWIYRHANSQHTTAYPVERAVRILRDLDVAAGQQQHGGEQPANKERVPDTHRMIIAPDVAARSSWLSVGRYKLRYVEREILTWQAFGEAARKLASDVVESGYRPDVILAIARGGLIPAGAVAYALNLLNVVTVNVEFYTEMDERLELPIMLPPVLDVTDIAGSTVLVVDDITDTGKTMQLVRDFCADHVADVRCAVIYQKLRSEVNCEYVWGRTDKWVEFPWSVQGPVRGAVGQM